MAEIETEELIRQLDRQIGAVGFEERNLRLLQANPDEPNPRLQPLHMGSNILWMLELRAVLAKSADRLATLQADNDRLNSFVEWIAGLDLERLSAEDMPSIVLRLVAEAKDLGRQASGDRTEYAKQQTAVEPISSHETR